MNFALISHAQIDSKSMFGGPDSCRKQHGSLIKDNEAFTLPSMRSRMTQLTSGTTAPSKLGSWLVERTGKPLDAIWVALSQQYGSRVPIHRLPERLQAIGAGVLGSRELGQLHQDLRPAADGTIGYDDWVAAFCLAEPTTPQNQPAYAGMTTAEYTTRMESIPHMREGAPLPDAQAPYGVQLWPGGFRSEDIRDECMQRLAASGHAEPVGRSPFATDRDKQAPVLQLQPAQPTCPPYAVDGEAASVRPPSTFSTSTAQRRHWSVEASAAPTAPFATEQNSQWPSDRPRPSVTIAPFATMYDSRGAGAHARPGL
jgi:hypothetical protein